MNKTLILNRDCLIHIHIQVYGIKGASVFLLHPAFNMAKGFVIDDLHAVYLGVTLRHTGLESNTADKITVSALR